MTGTIWFFPQEEWLLGIHHCGIIFYWFFSFKQTSQCNIFCYSSFTFIQAGSFELPVTTAMCKLVEGEQKFLWKLKKLFTRRLSFNSSSVSFHKGKTHCHRFLQRHGFSFPCSYQPAKADLEKQSHWPAERLKARWAGKCPSVPKPEPSGKVNLQHGARCMMRRQRSMDMGHKEDFLLGWEA